MRARRPSAKRRWYPGLLALAAFLSALPAAAQAWTPPAGAGAVGIVYQTIDNTGHRLTDGSFLPGYESESRAIHLQVDYAVSDRLSFSIGVPYIFSKYSGAEPSFSGLPVDECRCWNHGWQDVGASVRYNLINGRLFAVTPSISIGVPTNDYNYFGEAVAGRNLTEMRIGVAAGQRLDIISPRFSLQESYSYAVVEKVLGLPNNRSNFSVEPAFQITRKLAAGAI
ncbi:MAG: hypothetical protein ABIO78_06440, partial [Thermoanaerobaculia bacterium]